MKKNIGLTERVIRVLACLGIVSMAVAGPPYALLGISTCKSCK
ncbi:MAG: hypothetical protein ACM3MB_08470 [Acidobacteriota bacterium]